MKNNEWYGEMTRREYLHTYLFTSRYSYRLWLYTPSYYALPYGEDVSPSIIGSKRRQRAFQDRFF